MERQQAIRLPVLFVAVLLSGSGCAEPEDVEADGGQDLCVSPADSTYAVRKDPYSGQPFHWIPPLSLWYAMAQAESTGLDPDAVGQAVRDGILLWNDERCLPMTLIDEGEADSSTFGYDPEGDRPQTLFWWVKSEESWTSRHSQVAIAVTSIFTEPWTGRVLDADIEFNAFGPHRWTVGLDAVSADIQSVVAHEFGHVLGLDHSRDPEAVMATGWVEGWLRKLLTEGDLAGLCTLYLCPELLDPQ